MKKVISFRVNSRGIIINLNPEADFAEIKTALTKHTRGASRFFAGVDLMLNCTGRVFSMTEMQELMDILSNYQDLKGIHFLSEEAEDTAPGTDTILINKTIRSGQKIKYPTNIVVIGDINPGAEVVAGGDIVVLGRLKGVVHAGATGTEEAQIVALKLQPTQLRIGKVISRSPDDLSDQESLKPERAFVKDGMILVENINI